MPRSHVTNEGVESHMKESCRCKKQEEKEREEDGCEVREEEGCEV